MAFTSSDFKLKSMMLLFGVKQPSETLYGYT